MKKYLNNYNTQSEYDSDEARKSLQSSTVSLVADKVVRDGVNVETFVPEFGDGVYHDGNKKVHFLKFGTIKKEQLPADFVPIGVCGPYSGSNIYIIDSRTENQKMAEYMHFEVSGWKLDGMDHSGKIKFYDLSLETDFVYNATTIEGCCAQLNDFLKANTTSEKPYIAYIRSGKTIMQCMNYNRWQDSSASISGLDVTLLTMQELPQCPSCELQSGDRAYPVWNLNRAIAYFENDSTSSAYNPTSEVKSMPSYPTCLPAYLGTSAHREKDMCAYLRERFGEGREGWLNYLKQRAPFLPYPKGMMSEEYGTGKINTYRLAGYKLRNEAGEEVSQYPAADFVAAKGFQGIPLLDKGDWFIPSAPEYMSIFRFVEFGNPGVEAESDTINNTLLRMGLPTLSCNANSWLVSRNYASSSWVASHTGGVDISSFCSRNRAVPVALYPIARQGLNV